MAAYGAMREEGRDTPDGVALMSRTIISHNPAICYVCLGRCVICSGHSMPHSVLVPVRPDLEPGPLIAFVNPMADAKYEYTLPLIASVDCICNDPYGHQCLLMAREMVDGGIVLIPLPKPPRMR